MALKRTYTNPQGPGVMTSYRKRGKYIRRPSRVRAPTFVPRRFGVKDNFGGVPPVARTQLVYYTGQGYANKSIAAATNTTYLFAGNGMFDPDLQVGGQQPMGYDQWGGLYRHYRVIGSRAELTCGHSALTQIALNYGGTELQTFTFDAQNSCALPGSKYSLGHTLGGTMAGNIKLVSYARTDALTGFNYTDDLVSAQTTANPSTIWCWAVTVCNADAVSAQNFSFSLRITYFVEWFHPQAITMS